MKPNLLATFYSKEGNTLGWIKCIALRIVDGDTIKVKVVETFKNKEFYISQCLRVRLAGIDTPEINHFDESLSMPFAFEAREFVCDFLKFSEDFEENEISSNSCVFDVFAVKRDQYDRILAFLFVNNKMLNMHLLYNGYAELYEGPDAQYYNYSKWLKVALSIGVYYKKGIYGMEKRESTMEYKKRLKYN
ncbi:lcl3 [Ecytonucleospora hepatopenaei]|uniref:Lcl3 n=1 Tax=Ecytonucleospora hepatopenaei TaxID=646526 RepID=A0A1W0E4D7_9MICR|nr:lcl3 [Ecytonucleospora hepatopenaei]